MLTEVTVIFVSYAGTCLVNRIRVAIVLLSRSHLMTKILALIILVPIFVPVTDFAQEHNQKHKA